MEVTVAETVGWVAVPQQIDASRGKQDQLHTLLSQEAIINFYYTLLPSLYTFHVLLFQPLWNI